MASDSAFKDVSDSMGTGTDAGMSKLSKLLNDQPLMVDHVFQSGMIMGGRGTLLHHACFYGDSECVKYLLDKNADKNMKYIGGRYDGLTPQALADRVSRSEIARLLQNYDPVKEKEVEIDKLTDTITNTKKEMLDLKTKVEQYENMKSQKDSEIQQLKERCADAETKAEALKKKFSQPEEKFGSDQYINKLLLEKKDLLAQLKEKDTKNRQLEIELKKERNNKDKIKALENKVQTLEKTKLTLENRITAFEKSRKNQ
jgi:ankyrin repeat protein